MSYRQSFRAVRADPQTNFENQIWRNPHLEQRRITSCEPVDGCARVRANARGHSPALAAEFRAHAWPQALAYALQEGHEYLHYYWQRSHQG